MQKAEALSPQIAKNGVYTGNVAAWAPESGGGWRDGGTDNRKRRGDSSNRPHHQYGGAGRSDNGYLPANEVGSEAGSRSS